MTNRQLKEMMRDIPPRYQQKADARAAAAMIQSKPVLPRIIGAAAVCCAGMAAVMILPRHHANGMNPATSAVADIQEMTSSVEDTSSVEEAAIAEDTSSVEDEAIAEDTSSVEEAAAEPWEILLNSTLRLTSPAYAPYALEPTENQYHDISDTLENTVWTPLAQEEFMPDGESVTLHILNYYDQENPVRMVFYGNGHVQIARSSGEESWYQIPAEAEAVVRNAAHDQDDPTFQKRLTWCQEGTLDTPEFWDNILIYQDDCDMTTQEGIYNRMRNSINYFGRVSGTVVSADQLGVDDDITYGINIYDFQCDLNMGIGYEEAEYYKNDTLAEYTVEDVKGLNYEISRCSRYEYPACYEAYADQDVCYRTMHDDRHRICYSDPITYSDVQSEPDLMVIRDAIIPGVQVMEAIQPEYYCTVFLQDLSKWEITGTTEMFGRPCVTLHGYLDGNPREALDVSEYDMTIDTETGILLRYVGYNSNGEMTDYLHTENMKFNEDADCVKAMSVHDMEIVDVP